ncbi:MAG: carboxypeptidase-like regulatory domain-containing protein [Bacteroidota bacterium]|nr:carboxypeptidase-like regulatory domain-containing protein [Bacteroidota bacterium]
MIIKRFNTIRIITTGITGLIAGVVSPPISHSEVWGFSTDDTISTFTDTSGQFKLIYLPPSIYSVKIVPSNTLYQDTILTNIEVLASQTTNLDTINLRLK